MKLSSKLLELMIVTAIGIGLFAQLSVLVEAMPLTHPSTIVPSSISDVTASPWITKTAMPTARGLASAAVIDGVIYVIGGWTVTDTNIVEAYYPSTDSWLIKTGMNVPRNNLTTAVLDNKIYAIGGWSVTTNTTAVEIYDPLTDMWTSGTPLPVGINGLRAATFDGKIFVFGGWDGNTITNTVMMYDPKISMWIPRTRMPTARTNLAVAVINGKIYAIGGEYDGTELDTLEIYDPIADTWITGTPMLSARGGIAAGVVHGRIQVVSGANDRYDPATDSWDTMTSVPTGRWGLTAAVVDNNLYTIGGWSETEVINVNQMYTAPFPGIVNVPGDYQALLGCSDIWLPDCSITAMTEIGNNQWVSGPFELPAGDYECKVAIDGSWAENYGWGGIPDGPNIPFSLDQGESISFIWDEQTKLLTVVKYKVFLPTIVN